MAKKSEGTGSAPAVTRRKRQKGGFAVFKKEENHWVRLVEDDFENMSKAEKAVKEKAETLQGATVMIVQIKKLAELKVETTTKVKVSF